VDPDKAKVANAPPVRADGGNVATQGGNQKGNADEAFQRCAAVSEGVYEAQTRLHCCLETHGHVCKWDGDSLTVWASTQAVTGMKSAFGMQPTRVICEYMGGGFGSKFGPGPEGAACAQLAKMARAPVKLMLTRRDEQLMNFRGPGIRSRIKLGAAADGTFLAAEVRNENYGGTAANVGNPMNAGFYIIDPPNFKVQSETVLTNTAAIAALRAPGHPQASWCWELAMDDLAVKLKMDPLEFRKKNHGDPVRNAQWKRGAELIGWSRRNKEPGVAPGVLKRGMGMASAQWGGGGGPGSICEATVGRDGSVRAVCATQDIGTGTPAG